MANWEDLNIEMPLDKPSMLRVLISSRDKVIGQCTLSRSKLLGGRKNQKGFFVVRPKNTNFLLFCDGSKNVNYFIFWKFNVNQTVIWRTGK